ncbi:MAG: hypothetical protein HY911_04380 [Desulfobacterales bacterium]|nr:hypothetical protein [Desulfobacterales bacterium]
MTHFDSELIADFIEEYSDLFEAHLERRGIDSAEAGVIADDVRKAGAAC